MTAKISFNPSVQIDAQDLIQRILKVDPKEGIPIDQILKHPFIQRCSQNQSSQPINSTFIQQPSIEWSIYKSSNLGDSCIQHPKIPSELKVEVYKEFSSHIFPIKVNEEKVSTYQDHHLKPQESRNTGISPHYTSQSNQITGISQHQLTSKSTSNLISSSVYRQIAPLSRQLGDSHSYHLQNQGKPMSLDRKPTTMLLQSRSMESPPVALTISPQFKNQEQSKFSIVVRDQGRTQVNTQQPQGMHHSSSTPRLNLSASTADGLSKKPSTLTGFVSNVWSNTGVVHPQNRGYLTQQIHTSTPRLNTSTSSRTDYTRIYINSNLQESLQSSRSPQQTQNM